MGNDERSNCQEDSSAGGVFSPSELGKVKGYMQLPYLLDPRTFLQGLPHYDYPINVRYRAVLRRTTGTASAMTMYHSPGFALIRIPIISWMKPLALFHSPTRQPTRLKHG